MSGVDGQAGLQVDAQKASSSKPLSDDHLNGPDDHHIVAKTTYGQGQGQGQGHDPSHNDSMMQDHDVRMNVDNHNNNNDCSIILTFI